MKKSVTRLGIFFGSVSISKAIGVWVSTYKFIGFIILTIISSFFAIS